MATGGKSAKKLDGVSPTPAEGESSDSDGETEPAKSFHRRWSTNREINNSAAIKEGYLLKHTWTFQRWRKRYFKLMGRKLFYSKDPKAVIFDEIELTDLCLAECSTKNVNHSFQLITPFRSLVLCCESRREMEEWLSALTAASQRRYHELEPDCLSGQHHWYAPSFDARPTYCNVCRYKINARHLLRCEVCKFNVHKRCAAKAINNCKWTTLASVGKDIIEDADGHILMPHQWMEGNLAVLSRCAVCNAVCGSVLSLQDWRCLWCHATVHTHCRPNMQKQCPLGPARVSVVPPTALHSVQDEAWEVVRPQASSPLLVFVNSKSGDNQGVKFLRRFKQLLNPAQVFDLISTGPRLGLRLFRHFDPFRILVCSGDGSVGWVLSEIDKLDMHKQCQVAVLPLGTGNDLARVLGWGASCDSDAHLPQLLEKYERASVQMLDRWSVMAFERTIAVPKLSLTPGQPEGQLHIQITQYEESLKSHLQNILQSDETSVIINSAKVLCETVKDLRMQISESSITRSDEQLLKLSDVLQQKQDLLLQALTNDVDVANFASTSNSEDSKKQDDTDSEISFDRGKSEKCEKELSNINFRKHRRTSRFVEREKDALNNRANSLKKALRNLVQHTEQVFEDRTRTESEVPAVRISLSNDIEKSPSSGRSMTKMDSLKVASTMESVSSSEGSSCPSPTGSVVTARLVNISPIPDIRRDSVATMGNEDPDLLTLPVPPDFADSRRSSRIQQCGVEDQFQTEKILLETASTLVTIEKLQLSTEDLEKKEVEKQRRDSKPDQDDRSNFDDEKECSSIISAISNDETSFASEIMERGSFVPRKGSDGEDVNGHICHIDSPETDTYPTSDVVQGESLMDDISSMIGEILCGYDQDSVADTYTDDTTLFHTELERKLSVKKDSLERKRRNNMRRKSAPGAPRTEDTDQYQYGFENRAFMSQHVYLDNRYNQPQRYCSLAQFVEGSDIARRSFKRRNTNKTSKTEANVSRQSTLHEEAESLSASYRGSVSSINKLAKELSNVSATTVKEAMDKDLEKESDKESEKCKFPPVSVIVEPPSPILTEQARSERMECIRIEIEGADDDLDLRNLYSKSDKLSISDVSNNSSTTNLLTVDHDPSATRSPAATRRISCCSMLNPQDAAALAATAAASTKFYHESGEKKEKKPEDKEAKKKRKLPIINPLVRLPSWPNVTTSGGFISKCLLANADTLCAAVSPLMDPEETLMEGFYERCVMNNYFGIGIDAKISLDFHHKREEHPEKCRSRAKNYLWYGVLGGKELLQRTFKNLEQRVQLECDGQRIPLPSLQGIVILNIPRFMGGINFWGGSKMDDVFIAPSFDDKILEVVAVFGSMQMAASRMMKFQHHRIAQCQSIQINILGDEGVPIQVDGEAWIQPPGIIRILHKNRMQMLGRNRALENSLKSWEEKQRQSIAGQGGAKPRLSISGASHDKSRSSVTRQSMPGHTTDTSKSFLGVTVEKIRQHSFSGAVPHIEKEKHSVTFVERPPERLDVDILFGTEEHYLLMNFIECATSLSKWIKILAISHTLETDLYALASITDACLESIHPQGKILTGPALRSEFSKLVESVKQLYEESCCLLHDRNDKLKLREDLESKLSVSLANVELELRKCVLFETSEGSMVCLQAVPEESEHKRKGMFWLKFRKSVSSERRSSSCKREVASWGTHEVATWLDTLQLTEYIDSFEKNDIRGRELLTLARRDLKDLGVTKVGHVKRILQAIKDLSQGV
ncbi:diacylglycerol kinase eta [Dendroctonus ponderosae]|uniref:diacylglycerol kinase eta n=1 Tax=Dendroctonus ponderosae TaxID=77166 RepID=UPI002036243C|nr:diacylglycerol kinase eta [Dendroctonus ponderosae]